MWYEEEFCAVMAPRSISGIDSFIGELNALGKDGWDIALGHMRVDDLGMVVMNRQRQIRTEEKVDRVLQAIQSYDRNYDLSAMLSFTLPNTQSDDGRIAYEGEGALRQLIRMVLEES